MNLLRHITRGMAIAGFCAVLIGLNAPNAAARPQQQQFNILGYLNGDNWGNQGRLFSVDFWWQQVVVGHDVCRRRRNPPGVRSSNPAAGSGGSVLLDGGSCLGGGAAGSFVGSVAAPVEVYVVGGVDEPVEHALGDDRVGEQRIPVDGRAV